MSGPPTSWLAGTAANTFSVSCGTPMAGYMARTGPSTGTLDELTVSALVLNQESAKVVFLAVDLAGVDDALVDAIATSAGLDRSDLVICPSHTHSGPAGVISRLHPADEDRLSPHLHDSFVATSVETIATAKACIEPVELLFGRSKTSGLAANRNDPDGPFDPYVSVLATRRANGDFAAVVVHFACHPTILSAENRLISADFSGALRRSLRAIVGQNGDPPVVLYANGAAGDVSTRFTRHSQDVAEVERVGAGLAAAAHSALAEARSIDGPIRYGRETVALPPRELVEPDNVLASSTGRISTAEERKQITRRQGAALLTKLVEAGPDAIRTSLELEAWAVGDLTLVAVPGELFASLGARITKASSTLLLGYANGYVGYLADNAAYEAQTYEALASPFAPGAGEIVAEAGLDLVNRIRTGNER